MQQSQENVLNLIEAKSIEIGSWLNQRVSEIRIIREYPACKSLDFERCKPYISNLNKVLKENYGNQQETFAIGGMDGKGWVNDKITIDISNRDYFEIVMNSDMEYIVSRPVVSKSDNKEIFLICYPIVNDNGEKIGFINGSIALDLISKITDQIDLYNGVSWIMYSDGTPYKVSDEWLKHSELKSDSLDLIAKHIDNHSGIIDTKAINGKDALVFYSQVPYAQDWILCTLIDKAELNVVSNQVINIIIISAAAILVLASIIALAFSESITRPIKILKEQMLEVASGNFDVKYTGKGRDEISVLASVFNKMTSDLKNLMNQVKNIEQQKRQAELRALQSQINPHFLYNTLDTIQWKALKHNATDVADMIQLLSGLFRISLSSGKEMIPLEYEIQHVDNYLQIQQIRYNDKISYHMKIDNLAKKCYIPKIIIQPLVENSIYHGLKPKRHQGDIYIECMICNDDLQIIVEDNGIGIEESRLDLLIFNLKNRVESNHYGLYNVNERLLMTYGTKCTIQIISEVNVGTKIIIRIPIQKEGDICLEH
ncbi:MAG: sensor histidine kinase [Anaerorhabdus sp.]|uniref:sensor histidine kinase n=1 Tax=Anaerorhabdus sp. TaxID=1872524 RepID=UPI003A863FB4